MIKTLLLIILFLPLTSHGQCFIYFDRTEGGEQYLGFTYPDSLDLSASYWVINRTDTILLAESVWDVEAAPEYGAHMYIYSLWKFIYLSPKYKRYLLALHIVRENRLVYRRELYYYPRRQPLVYR
jgi:hypothetical protein